MTEGMTEEELDRYLEKAHEARMTAETGLYEEANRRERWSTCEEMIAMAGRVKALVEEVRRLKGQSCNCRDGRTDAERLFEAVKEYGELAEYLCPDCGSRALRGRSRNGSPLLDEAKCAECDAVHHLAECEVAGTEEVDDAG